MWLLNQFSLFQSAIMETSPKTLLRSDISKIENEREQSLGSLELKPRSELDKYKLPSNRQVLERKRLLKNYIQK